MDVLGPTDIWPDPRSDSPTGCLATEREVEYFKSGCSFSRTRQLAGAMAFWKQGTEKSAVDLQKKTKERAPFQQWAAEPGDTESWALPGRIWPIRWRCKTGPVQGSKPNWSQPVTSWQTAFHCITQIYHARSADQIRSVCSWGWSQLSWLASSCHRDRIL